jgi:DNA-directed RNA polymerase subunit E'/Rpb7
MCIKMKYRLYTYGLEIMSEIRINKWIDISPEHIGNGINRKIEEEVNKQMDGMCTSEHGYVLKVLNITDILENRIRNTTSAFQVRVGIDILVFKPVVGDIIPGCRVCAIYDDGIFMDVYDKQKILVQQTDTPLKQGDIVPVKITAVRYVDHRYSCIGETCGLKET